MCWLCDEYGDPNQGDGLWYLNPRNYARNLYKLRDPAPKPNAANVAFEEGGKLGSRRMLPDLINALENNNLQEVLEIRDEMNEDMFSGGGCQIVPLRDAEKLLDLCSIKGLMACVCRNWARGIDERNENEYTCMGLGVGMLKAERWPERYKGGTKLLNADEAKEWNREMDKRGFVHMLMIMGAPYIGGFCQCDYLVCNGMRWAVDFGIGTLKSHYVATIDYATCNGCGICAQRCQFGALKYEVTSRQANIDQFQCYGCGLCETGCPRGAIKLELRSSIPALADVWR